MVIAQLVKAANSDWMNTGCLNGTGSSLDSAHFFFSLKNFVTSSLQIISGCKKFKNLVAHIWSSALFSNFQNIVCWRCYIGEKKKEKKSILQPLKP